MLLQTVRELLTRSENRIKIAVAIVAFALTAYDLTWIVAFFTHRHLWNIHEGVLSCVTAGVGAHYGWRRNGLLWGCAAYFTGPLALMLLLIQEEKAPCKPGNSQAESNTLRTS